MTYHYTWVMVFSVSLLKYPKNQVQRWRLLLMRCTLQLSRTLRKESFDITHTTSAGTMECFHKLGRTHLLQTLMLMVLLEIKIQLMWLRLVTRGKIGEITKVKPLGALAMIDEGELDWKIVAISLDDPRASLVNHVDDVEKHFPGTLTAIRDWFRDYKIPDGKPANSFGLGNKAANKDYTLKVITETNEHWAKLVKRSIPAGELSLL